MILCLTEMAFLSTMVRILIIKRINSDNAFDYDGDENPFTDIACIDYDYDNVT